MKKIICSVLLIISLLVYGDIETYAYYDFDMNEFNQNINNLNAEGNLISDYLNETILYKKTIIKLGKSILEENDDETLNMIICDMCNEKEKEINFLSEIQSKEKLNSNYNKKKETYYLNRSREIHKSVIKQLNEFNNSIGIEKTQNYILTLIQGEIKLDTNILRYIDDNELKDYVKEMINVENRNIEKIY